MNIVSCPKCGVVLDRDNLTFPDTHDEDGDPIEGTSVWNGDGFTPVAKCPVCKGDIRENDEGYK